MALGAEPAGDQLGEPAVVFDQEDLHGLIVAGRGASGAILTGS